MRRFHCSFAVITVAILLYSGFFTLPSYGEKISVSYPSVSAQSAAVMVVGSGELLYEKDAHTRRSMASTTKIMTSLLALEECDPQRVITVTDAMVRVEGTSMGLQVGDSVTLSVLVHGMLLESGNDAANCTALALAGDAQSFAERMNKRAKELEMKNSNFVTPSGLDAQEHYSTAYDMALLGCAALQNVEFAGICAKKSARVSFGNPSAVRTLYNHNRMLRSYDGAVGIKTGFTKKSGRCLVSAATKDGVTLVAVTLNAPNDWQDHKAMLDYGFSVVERLTLDTDVSQIRLQIYGGAAQSVTLTAGTQPIYGGKQIPAKVERQVLLKKFEYAPLEKGKTVGELRYFVDGKLLSSVPIVTAQAVGMQKAEQT